MSRRRRRNNTGTFVLLILLIILMIAATIVLIKLCLDIPGRSPESKPDTQPLFTVQTEPVQTQPPTETTMPEPEHVVATATIGSMGDLLMHMPIFDDWTKYNAAVQQSDGSYDFESVFRYLTEYISPLDFAAANLETTLCGTENGYAYSGYPLFNCQDAVSIGYKNLNNEWVFRLPIDSGD